MLLNSEQVLDHYYLESRCMLIELAATLDRHDRGKDAPDEPSDPRLERIYKALAILSAKNAEANRAERLLMLFSDPV